MPRRRFYMLLVIVIIASGTYLAYSSTSTQPRTPPSTAQAPAQTSTVPGQMTKTSGCVIVDAKQDPACTPGAIIPTATAQQICVPGYSKSVRSVPAAEKRQVYAEYGIASHQTGEYEVDHLISLELGGSNDISNLWPEAASPRPGFHEKDAAENYLHAQVCNGSLSLSVAQQEIAGDWSAVYRAMAN